MAHSIFFYFTDFRGCIHFASWLIYFVCNLSMKIDVYDKKMDLIVVIINPLFCKSKPNSRSVRLYLRILDVYSVWIYSWFCCNLSTVCVNKMLQIEWHVVVFSCIIVFRRGVTHTDYAEQRVATAYYGERKYYYFYLGWKFHVFLI